MFWYADYGISLFDCEFIKLQKYIIVTYHELKTKNVNVNHKIFV